MDPGKENLEFPSPLGNENEDEKMDFPKGVLSHLELLEFRAHREALEQEEKEQQQEKLIFLKAKIRELRLQRDRLREKVELLEKSQLGKEGIPSGISSPWEVLEWKVRNLQSLLQLFQLTGLSAKLSRHGICFSIHTSFEGSLLDSFHLELLLPRNPGINSGIPEFRILRHSVPAFIPLERLSREFLPSDLRAFLDRLSRHLNAFVGRRRQLELLQEEFSDCIQGIPQKNSLCNLLSFRYTIPGKNQNSREMSEFPGKEGIPGKNQNSQEMSELPGKEGIPGKNRNSREMSEFPGKEGIPGKSGNFQARLLYQDPLRSLPTEVTVSCAPESPEAASAHAELFRRLTLPRAFQALKSMDFTP